MAFSLNKAMLIGNLGKDAEQRFTTTNLSVTTFSLATTYGYKGKDGNWVNETTWHNIVAYNLSDYYRDQLKKGKKFYIEGRISRKEYTDKEGIKRYSVDIVADKLIPLESTAPDNGSKDRGMQETGEADVHVDENDDLPF